MVKQEAGFTVLHGSVELGPGFALLDPSWLGPPKPRVPDQHLPSSILAGVWPDQQRAPPQPPGRAVRGTANWAFQTPAVSLALLPPSLHVPLSFSESLPAAQLLESVKMTFGIFSSCLKGLMCFVFPSVTAEHRKWSSQKM